MIAQKGWLAPYLIVSVFSEECTSKKIRVYKLVTAFSKQKQRLLVAKFSSHDL